MSRENTPRETLAPKESVSVFLTSEQGTRTGTQVDTEGEREVEGKGTLGQTAPLSPEKTVQTLTLVQWSVYVDVYVYAQKWALFYANCPSPQQQQCLVGD